MSERKKLSEFDLAFFRLLEALPKNMKRDGHTEAVWNDMRIMMMDYRDLQDEVDRQRAVVSFFRNALPWAMRKSMEIDGEGKPPPSFVEP